MKDLQEVKDDLLKPSGTKTGALIGGVGATIVAGVICPLGALAIPIAAAATAAGALIGKKIDDKK